MGKKFHITPPDNHTKPRKGKANWHKRFFVALYLLIVVALFGLFYNFVVRDEGGTADTYDESSPTVSKYDTLDVIGDYLWSGMKLDEGIEADEDKDKDKDKKDEAEKVAPVVEAEAATEKDIEDATGLSSADPATASKSAEEPKAENPNAPKIEAIE